jgi:hypothetical protein
VFIKEKSLNRFAPENKGAEHAFNSAKFCLAILLCCGISVLLLLSIFVHDRLWQFIALCAYSITASCWILYKIRCAYSIARKEISRETL